MKFSGGYAAM